MHPFGEQQRATRRELVQDFIARGEDHASMPDAGHHVMIHIILARLSEQQARRIDPADRAPDLEFEGA